MRNALIILLTFFSLPTKSQIIRFLDSQDKKPVEGLVVMYLSVQDGSSGQVITNIQGEAQITQLPFPAVIRTSHMAFHAFSDTLKTARDYQFALDAKRINLEDFIVTGQFNPQSAENSVFNVQVIDRSEIEARGAVNLAEALASSLNIRMSPDLATGSTGIGLQGISGQNVKILLDGIPIVNRNGNGNAADLSQINLNNIERIEIVEGPMAVNYGANALAGVINLISSKSSAYSTEINFNLQEETVGSEFGPGKGRHIQSLNVRQNITEKWFAQVGVLRNDFDGFMGNATGRTKEWNPKHQLQGNALVKFRPKNHEVYYRLDFLDEVIDDHGLVQNNFLPSGENQPFAIDEKYATQRSIHHLQAEGKLPFLNRYNAFVSFSDFERLKSRTSKNFVTGNETKTTALGDQDVSTYRVWEFGGTAFDSFSSALDIQAGYQITLENVGGGRIQEGEQAINDLAFYTSLEWQPSEKTTFRPGVRLATNSVFGTQLIPSLQAKTTLGDDTNLRFAYGRGYRAPSVRELYFEFVDSNHRIFGNPELSPEFSHHLSANLSKNYVLFSQPSSTEVKAFYNTINDMIGLAQSALDATATTYINVDMFRTLGFGVNQSWQRDGLKADIGLSYIGRYNQLDQPNEDELNTYFFTPEVSANLQYQLSKTGVSMNFFYKYTGSLKNYIFNVNDLGEQEVGIGQMDGFHWLDLSLSKSLFTDLDLLIGARNLLNIQRINNSGVGGGGHSGGSSVPVSYGRSYFIKLNYNLKLK